MHSLFLGIVGNVLLNNFPVRFIYLPIINYLFIVNVTLYQSFKKNYRILARRDN